MTARLNILLVTTSKQRADTVAALGKTRQGTVSKVQQISDDQDSRCSFLGGYARADEPHGVHSEIYYLPQPSQVPAARRRTAWAADRTLAFTRTLDT